MKLEQLHAAYRQLAPKHGLPPMQLAKLTVEPAQRPDDPAQLWQAIEDCAPDAGWLCFQSAVLRFEQGQLPQPTPELGYLLSAECCSADATRSHSLRQRGDGGWLLTPFRHGVGEDLLCDQLSLVRHDAGSGSNAGQLPGRLRYRRYWRLDPQLGPCQAAACFIGFRP